MHGPFNHGDIVGVNHLGREFFALVEEDDGQAELDVRPITHGITYFHISKRDVKSIHRFSRGTLPTIKNSGGPTWGGPGNGSG